jgi:hypothetical protein
MHNLAFLTFWLKWFSEQLSVVGTPLSAVLVLPEPSLATLWGGDGERGRGGGRRGDRVTLGPQFNPVA